MSELNSDSTFEDEQPHLHGSMTADSHSLVPEAQIDDVQTDEDIADDDNEEIVSTPRKGRRLAPYEKLIPIIDIALDERNYTALEINPDESRLLTRKLQNSGRG